MPPNADYISYLDYRVLALLFCLMLVVAGLQGIGLFSCVRLLGGIKTTRQLCFYLILFLLCLACVIRLLPWQVMLAILVCALLLKNRKLFRQVDYFLLLTFVCFFVFIGNMERIPVVSSLLRSFIEGREFLLGILFSQCISNVPAAILLSGFTDDIRPLLYGVNAGGLGTLIASLASVISFRCYTGSKGAHTGAYLKTFTIYNVVFLAVLGIAAMGMLW